MKHFILLTLLLLSTSFISFTQCEKEIDGYWDYANELANKGDLHDAIKVINAIIDSSTKRDLNPIYNLRARIYLALKYYELALNDAHFALSNNNKDTISHHVLIEIRFKTEKYNLLIKESEEAILKIGDHFYFRWVRGLSYHYLNKNQAAIEEFSACITLDPNSEIGYSLRGNAYWNNNEIDKAIIDYNKAYAILPKFEIARNLANIHSEIKDTMTSINYYKETLKFKKDEDCLFDLASKLYNNNNFIEAIPYFDTLISVAPNSNLNYYICRADAYAFVKKYDKAFLDYNKVTSLDKDNSTAYNNRAFCCWLPLKNYKEAKHDLLIAVAIKDNFDLAWNNLSYANYKLGLLDEALSSSNRAIQLNYDNSYIFKNLALIHYAKKNKELAITNAKKAIELGYPLKEDKEFLVLLKKLKIKYD